MNRSLSERGCGYRLAFKPVDPENYYEIVRQMLGAGDQIDILFSGLRTGSEISTYYSFAKEGIFEPLTDFLNTESGQKLWDSIPEKQWEAMKIDNVIYGVDASAQGVLGAPAYLFNKKLTAKYDIPIEQLNKPIWELDSIFEKVFTGSNDDKFSVIYPIDLTSPAYMLENKFNLTNAIFMNPNKNEQPFICVLDDKGYVEFLRALCVYSQKGYINRSVTDWFNPDNYFVLADGMAEKSPADCISEKFTDTEGNKGGLVPVVYSDEVVLRSTGFATGIVSGSKHKQEAFDLLAMIYTDPELTNLLVYGIENKDYNLANGKVMDNSKYFMTRFTFGNMFISHPGPEESKDKLELYRTLWDKSNDRFAGFILDTEDISEEIAKTNGIITSLSGVYKTRPEDFGEFIEELRQNLEEAGVYRIIEEANTQFSEWEYNKKQGA